MNATQIISCSFVFFLFYGKLFQFTAPSGGNSGKEETKDPTNCQIMTESWLSGSGGFYLVYIVNIYSRHRLMTTYCSVISTSSSSSSSSPSPSSSSDDDDSAPPLPVELRFATMSEYD